MNVYFYKLWCEFYHVVIILSNYLNINHFRAFNLLCFVKVRISEFSARFDQVVFSNLVAHLRTGGAMMPPSPRRSPSSSRGRALYSSDWKRAGCGSGGAAAVPTAAAGRCRMQRWPVGPPGFPDSPCYCISLTHRVRAGAASSTWLPWMARPRVTVAPGAALRMSRSVWERPLPSWVQKGQMSLPVKS